jgi:hypothetical protein
MPSASASPRAKDREWIIPRFPAAGFSGLTITIAGQPAKAALRRLQPRWPQCQQVGSESPARMPDMAAFDYGAEAELFPGTAGPSRRQPVGYRRFASAAEALRFAMEELSAGSLAGAALEVGDERFDSRGMRQLYEAADYPLVRRKREDRSSATMPRTSQGSGPVAGSGAARKGRASQDRD